MGAPVRVDVLGSVRAEVGGVVVQPGRQLTRLLAALAIDAGRVVSDDLLIDRLWGEHLPSTARASLQVFVGRLRRMLEPDRVPGEDWSVIVRDGTGYRLVLGDDALDRRRFEAVIGQASQTVAADPDEALRLVEVATGGWRGQPWADVADEDWIAEDLLALADLRSRAETIRVDALLGLGRLDDATSAARNVAAAHPFDERARGRLMRALYLSGRQHEALAEYDRARRLLIEEVGVEPGPDLQRIRTAILDHDPQLGTTRSGATGSGSTNLHTPSMPLVGRRNEMDEVSGLVTRTGLVTLRGSAGSGKSRLATEIGWRMLERHADGVWFVDLDASGPEQDVASAVADVLALTGADGAVDDPLDLVCSFVADRRILVILDNCEHVAESAAVVATRLIAAGGGVRVLATSRRPLEVVGEQIVAVGPLDVPPPGAAKDEVIASPAARLFIVRAGEDRVDLDDPATLDAVTELVRALEGVPLALELAAGRLGVLSLSELLDAMADRFAVLVSTPGSQPERRLAVRASLDISHGLLSSSETELFDRLGLINGAITIDLFGPPGDPNRSEAGARLDRLVTTSLVDRVDTAGATGYRLLETTREYARLQLDERDGVQEATAWIAARVTSFVERSRLDLRGPAQREALAALDANSAAIRAFLDLLTTTGRSDLARPIAVGLASYWFLRPHRGEGARIITQLRAASDPTADALAWAELVQAEAECGRGKDNALDRLRPDLLETLRIFGEHGRDAELLTSVGLLAVGSAWQGDLPEMQRVRAFGDDALARLESPWHNAVNAFVDALAASVGGDLPGGLQQLCAARDRFADLGDRSWAARASYFAALVSQFLGDDAAFRTNVMAAVELSELAGACGMDGRIGLALADAAVESGDPRAEWKLLRASDLLERHGDAIGVARCRRELAFLATESGRDARATELFQRSLPILARLEPSAFALGLAQMMPLVRRHRSDEVASETMATVRGIEASLSGHSSPDLRRLRNLTRDWPRSSEPSRSFDAERTLDAVLGP